MTMKNAKNKEFLEFYDRYSSAILKHIYFRVSNWQLAEDIAQETFMKSWTYIAKNNKEIDDLKSFVYRISHNLIIDHYRRKPKLPLSLDNINPDAIKIDAVQAKEVDKKIEKKILEKNLMELQENYREIIVYRYIDDLTIDEIVKITGKSANNISVMIYRALKILKDKIVPCAVETEEE